MIALLLNSLQKKSVLYYGGGGSSDKFYLKGFDIFWNISNKIRLFINVALLASVE